MLNVENCCVTLDKVGECVINNLGTDVVVVVVVVVIEVVCRYTHGVFHNSYIVEGSCPGMLIIQLLRAYALGCFNHPNC